MGDLIMELHQTYLFSIFVFTINALNSASELRKYKLGYSIFYFNNKERLDV